MSLLAINPFLTPPIPFKPTLEAKYKVAEFNEGSTKLNWKVKLSLNGIGDQNTYKSRTKNKL